MAGGQVPKASKLSGRAEVVRHVTWFLEAVENLRGE